MKRSPKMVKHLSQGKRGGSSPLGKEIYIRQCFDLASGLSSFHKKRPWLYVYLDFCHFYQKVGCHLTKNILWFILISNMKKRSCQIIQFNSKTATEILNPVTDLCDFHFCQAFLINFLDLKSPNDTSSNIEIRDRSTIGYANIGFPNGPSFRYGNFFTSKNEARLFFQRADFKVKFPYLKPTTHSEIVFL